MGSTTVYTVPAGETAIVKSIYVFNLNASTNQFVRYLIDAGAFDKTTFRGFNLPATTGDYTEYWLVLPPGTELAIDLSTAIGLNYWISGTELEGVAD